MDLCYYGHKLCKNLTHLQWMNGEERFIWPTLNNLDKANDIGDDFFRYRKWYMNDTVVSQNNSKCVTLTATLIAWNVNVR